MRLSTFLLHLHTKEYYIFMNRFYKTLLGLIVMLAAVAFYGSCGEDNLSSNILMRQRSDRDSLYQYPYIVQHFEEDPILALAYVDTAEMKGLYSRDTILWMRSFIYKSMKEWDKFIELNQEIIDSKSFDGSSKFYVKRVLDLADAYKFTNQYDESLRTFMYGDSLAIAHGMKSMQAEADYGIGLLQCQFENYDLGLEMMKRSIDLYEEALKNQEQLILNVTYLYGNYASKLFSCGRSEETIEACQQRIKHIDQLKVVYAGKMPSGYADELYGYSYAYMASAYISMGKKAEAQSALQQLLLTNFSRSPMAVEFLSYIYTGLGEERKAIEYIKRNIAAYESDTFALSSQYQMLADAYEGLHDYQSQAEALKQYIEFYSFVKRSEQSQKVLELAEQFKTKEKEYELVISQGREKQARITSVAVGVILVLVLIGLVIVIKRNRDIARKNHSLVEHINELLDAHKRELSMMKPVAAPAECSEDVDGQDAKQKEENPEADREAATRRVQYYIYQLTSRKLFCASDFDREALLDELHLQKAGFWKNFNEVTGQNFAPYLLNLRLEYAADQIRQHPEYTVDAIAAESGFSSRATFYRNFSTRFGITPTIFREQCEVKN